MQASNKHHYMTAFYLKRWSGKDDKVCQYSQPHRQVVADRKHPNATGFALGLYSVAGVSAEARQAIEDRFMSRLDTSASVALEMLESGSDRINKEAAPRRAWSRFLISLLMRMPEDVAALKEGVLRDLASILPDMEAAYLRSKRPEDPASLSQYFDMLGPEGTEGFAVQLLPRLIDSKRIGQLLNDMKWAISRFSGDEVCLLTSDRPVLRSNTLTEPGAFLLLPIGPQTIFTAYRDQNPFVAESPLALADMINRHVVTRAIRYVYGMDDSYLPFIQQHFGTDRQPTLLEQRAREKRTLGV